jgi:hypothetical protein
LKGGKHGAAASRAPSMCIDDDVSPRTAAAIAAAAAESPLKRSTRSSSGIRGEQHQGGASGGARSGGAHSIRASSRERESLEGAPVVALVKGELQGALHCIAHLRWASLKKWRWWISQSICNAP